MKFVKCDKCGLTVSVGLVDSDYVCEGEKPFLISEREILDKEYDLCEDCYTKLQNEKELVEQNFVKDIGDKK